MSRSRFNLEHIRFLRLLDYHKAKIRRELIKAKNSYILSAARSYERDGHADPINLKEAHQKNILHILQMSYSYAIPEFARHGLRSIKSRKIETKEIDNYADRLINEYTLRYGLTRSKTISETTFDDVLNAITAGQASGLGIREIAKNIRAVQTLSAFRSEMIARTEIHSAATYGSIESVRAAEQDLGVKMLKFWLPTLDERTRESHADMEGEPGIPLDGTFFVGGENLDRPGDPAGSADNVINCRCAIAYEES